MEPVLLVWQGSELGDGACRCIQTPLVKAMGAYWGESWDCQEAGIYSEEI